MSLSVYQVKHNVLCEMLRGALRAAVSNGHGDDEISSVRARACAALYALLRDHDLDVRGRCRCCRGARAVMTRRRTCRVLVIARFYLQQPDGVLLRYLAGELDDLWVAAPGGVDPGAPEVISRLEVDPNDPRSQQPRSPAPPSRRSSGAVRGPLPDHGGPGSQAPDAPGSAVLQPPTKFHRTAAGRSSSPEAGLGRDERHRIVCRRRRNGQHDARSIVRAGNALNEWTLK